MIRPALIVLCALPLTTGCVAKSAFDLATMPVRAGGRAIETTADAYDRLTVSDSERDEKRGRAIRHREEQLGKLHREYGRERMRCDEGDNGACSRAARLRYEMDELCPQVPYEPR